VSECVPVRRRFDTHDAAAAAAVACMEVTQRQARIVRWRNGFPAATLTRMTPELRRQQPGRSIGAREPLLGEPNTPSGIRSSLN